MQNKNQSFSSSNVFSRVSMNGVPHEVAYGLQKIHFCTTHLLCTPSHRCSCLEHILFYCDFPWQNTKRCLIVIHIFPPVNTQGESCGVETHPFYASLITGTNSDQSYGPSWCQCWCQYNGILELPGFWDIDSTEHTLDRGRLKMSNKSVVSNSCSQNIFLFQIRFIYCHRRSWQCVSDNFTINSDY